MKQFVQNEEAVSPVIGVILMVAITVILAAVIAAFVFGMTGNVQSQKNVAVGLQKDGTALQVTIQGGNDLGTLQYLKVSVGGKDYFTEETSNSLVDGSTAPTTFQTYSVGEVFSTEDDVMSASSTKRVIVVGHFSDGQTRCWLTRPSNLFLLRTANSPEQI